jgi:hypothetical protein
LGDDNALRRGHASQRLANRIKGRLLNGRSARSASGSEQLGGNMAEDGNAQDGYEKRVKDAIQYRLDKIKPKAKTYFADFERRLIDAVEESVPRLVEAVPFCLQVRHKLLTVKPQFLGLTPTERRTFAERIVREEILPLLQTWGRDICDQDYIFVFELLTHLQSRLRQVKKVSSELRKLQKVGEPPPPLAKVSIAELEQWLMEENQKLTNLSKIFVTMEARVRANFKYNESGFFIYEVLRNCRMPYPAGEACWFLWYSGAAAMTGFDGFEALDPTKKRPDWGKDRRDALENAAAKRWRRHLERIVPISDMLSPIDYQKIPLQAIAETLSETLAKWIPTQ